MAIGEREVWDDSLGFVFKWIIRSIGKILYVFFVKYKSVISRFKFYFYYLSSNKKYNFWLEGLGINNG